MKQKTSEKVTKKKDDANKCRGMTVLPYVNGVTEKISRVMKSYNVSAASKPHTTLRSLLVHPEDKRDDHNTTDALYCLPCMNCDVNTLVKRASNLVPVLMNTKRKWKKWANRWSQEPVESSRCHQSINPRSQTMLSRRTTSLDGIGLRSLARSKTDTRDGWRKSLKSEKGGEPQYCTMDRDEGQYFLSHVFDELLEKSPKRRKPTGNTRFPASGSSTSVGSISLNLVLRRRADVLETYTVSPLLSGSEFKKAMAPFTRPYLKNKTEMYA